MTRPGRGEQHCTAEEFALLNQPSAVRFLQLAAGKISNHLKILLLFTHHFKTCLVQVNLDEEFFKKSTFLHKKDIFTEKACFQKTELEFKIIATKSNQNFCVDYYTIEKEKRNFR